MIEKLNSFFSPSVYRGNLDSGYGPTAIFKPVGEGNIYYFSHSKGTANLRPKFVQDQITGFTRIQKNISNLAHFGTIYPWSVYPCVLSGTLPNTLRVECTAANNFNYNRNSNFFSIDSYPEESGQYLDYSMGFEVEVFGSNVKKIRVFLSNNENSFLIFDTETLSYYVSPEITYNATGIVVHDASITPIGVLGSNQYSITMSFTVNRYVEYPVVKVSAQMLPKFFADGVTEIDGTWSNNSNSYILQTGDAIEVSNYFSYSGLYKYNYILNSSTDEKRFLTFDQAEDCPRVVLPLSTYNEKISSTFVKDSTPTTNDEGVWAGYWGYVTSVDYLPAGNDPYFIDPIPSIFDGEDAYRIDFIQGVSQQFDWNYPPNANFEKVRAFTPIATTNQKICSFSFYTKYVPVAGQERIGRYVGISPFRDIHHLSKFHSSFEKTQGPGVNSLYFTTIDIKEKTIVGYAGGLDYIEDLEVIEIPNSGGWIKIVYKCEAVDKEGTGNWPWAMPVVALVDQNGIPEVEIEYNPLNDDYFIMEGLNASTQIRNHFDLQKNPLHSFNYGLNPSYPNFINSNTRSEKVNFKIRGNFNSTSFFPLCSAGLNGGYNGGNFDIFHNLFFVRQNNKQFKLYMSTQYNFYTESSGSTSYQNIQGTPVGEVDFENLNLIFYNDNNTHRVIINNNLFSFQEEEELQDFYDFFESAKIIISQGNLGGGMNGQVSFFGNINVNTSEIPELVNTSISVFDSACLADRVSNLVILKEAPSEVEIELLKSL